MNYKYFLFQLFIYFIKEQIENMALLPIINRIKKNVFIKIAILSSLIIYYIIIYFYYINYNIYNINELKYNNYYEKDDITLVSAFYHIKSKHSFQDYIKWIENFLAINRSMIFFVDKSIYKLIIYKRPQNLQKKTIWIKMDIKDFYSYKNYLKEFTQSYEIDFEKTLHSVFLYLIWAEKCNFLKIAALYNYFKSKCFYWVDAGCFREKNKMKYYTENWPSSEKCYKDGRVTFNEIRKPSDLEKDELKKFNNSIHINFQNKFNIDGSLFGGKKQYIIHFFNLYYNTINQFIKNKIFIGKDQNIFAYIAYFNTTIVKLVYSGKWFYLRDYLTKNND